MTFRFLQAILLAALLAMAGPARAQSALDLTGQALLRSAQSARGSATAIRAAAPADVRILTTADGAPAVDVFVRLDHAGAVAGAVAAGLTVQTMAGDVAVGRVAVADLGDLAVASGVNSVSVSRGRPGLRRTDAALDGAVEAARNDAARADTRVDAVYAGTGLPRAYTGTGVVVGVVDSGIDYDHPAFVPSPGNPGLVRLLELLPDGPGQPGGQREFTAAEIAARTVTEVDPNGHGTHVAGTATGGTAPANARYRGVAPGAELVVVKANRSGSNADGGFADADVIASVQYIFDYATARGLPAVANLSLGGHSGAHDGTSNYERALDNLTGAGRVIVAAAGNEGTKTFHAGFAAARLTGYEVLYTTTLSPTTSTPLTLYGYAAAGGVGAVRPQIYTTSSTGALTLAGRSSQFITVTPGAAPVSGTVVDLATGTQVLARFTVTATTDPNNGLVNFQVDLRAGISSLAQADNFALGLRINSGDPGGRIDMWLGGGDNDTARFLPSPPTSPQTIRIGGDALQTVGQPASALRVISVGAYNTTNTWTDIDGTVQTRPFTLGARADFSSAGPTRDGRTGVDIAAPGNLIASAYTQDAPPQAGGRDRRLPGGLHEYLDGTSMASPHIAGIVALMLQADRTLSPERVLQIFQQTGRSDAFTGTLPNTTFGRGKVDALAAMQSVVGTFPPSQAGLFNPTVAPGDGAGYRLIGAPVAGFTVRDLAGLNLVQGVPAGAAGFPAQYPAAGHNVFPTYTGSGVYPRPSGTDQPLASGRGFLWYLYDRDIPASSSFGGGTSASRELTGFALSASGTAPTTNVTAVFADNPGDDFQMLANPFGRPLAISGITTAGGAVQGRTFFAYNPNGNAYVALTGTARLAVWQGVFAELVPATGPPPPPGAQAAAGDVTVTYIYALTDANPAPTFYGRDAAETSVRLTLDGTLASGAHVADDAAIVRLVDGAEAGWDALDASKPVPPGADVATIAPMITRNGAPYRLGVDSRAPGVVTTVPLSFESSAAGAFTLTWAASLPDGWAATLADVQTGTTVDLGTATEYAFSAAAAADGERFVLTLAPRGATAGEASALVLGLSAPAPNPSSGRSTLTLTLPAAEHVRAVVVDALGREVAVLLDAEAQGTVRLDVDAGRLAPGVYTVRVSGASFAEARRLTVVR